MKLVMNGCLLAWEGRYLGMNRVGAGARTRDEATIDEAAMVAACLAALVGDRRSPRVDGAGAAETAAPPWPLRRPLALPLARGTREATLEDVALLVSNLQTRDLKGPSLSTRNPEEGSTEGLRLGASHA
jgi:hypothetical protein